MKVFSSINKIFFDYFTISFVDLSVDKKFMVVERLGEQIFF